MTELGRFRALVMTAATTVAVACGSGAPRTETSAAPPPPAPKTVEERVARYRECWDYYNKQSWQSFKGCYTETAQSEQMGSRPPLVGAEAIVADARSFTEAFPDGEGTLRVVLAKQDMAVSLAQLNGTHNGPLMGPDGKPIPATKKPIGFFMGHVVHWDAMGEKAVREEAYLDSPTMMAQLGLMPGPARPVEPKPTAAPAVVVAAGSEGESKNVETFKTQLEAFNKHDIKGVESYNAPDAMFHDISAPKDSDGKSNAAELSGFFKAFSDCRLVTTSVWGAGEYVVAQGTFEGTNDGPAPRMGIKRATKKSVKVPFLEITRYEGGKVKDDWVMFDSMVFAQQFGLMKPAQ